MAALKALTGWKAGRHQAQTETAGPVMWRAVGISIMQAKSLLPGSKVPVGRWRSLAVI